MRYGELKIELKSHGSHLHRQGRSHEIWICEATGQTFTVSRHDREEVPIGTLKSIKKSAGLE